MSSDYNPAKLPGDEWCVAACVGIATTSLLFTLAKIIKIKFSRTHGKINRINLKPFYLASTLLLLYIADAVLQLNALYFDNSASQRFKDFIETLILIFTCAIVGT